MANIKQILRTCFLITMMPCGIIIPGFIIYAFFSSVVGPRITAMGACSNYPGCLYGVVNGRNLVSVWGFSGDNSRLLSRGEHTLIHDATNGKILKRLNPVDKDYRYSIASDRNEIIAYNQNNVKVFDWDGELVGIWTPEAETTIHDVVRVPLLKGFLVAEEAGVSVRHGDGTLIAWLREGDGYMRVATSANGDYVAAYNEAEKRIMVWPLQRLRDGVVIREDSLPLARISRDRNFLQLSDDGSLIAVRGREGTYVWQTADGSLVMAVEPEEQDVTAVAFSPMGDRLAVGFNNGAIGIFDVTTRQMVERFDLSNPPSRLVFDADGNRLAMGLSSTSRVVSGGELLFDRSMRDGDRGHRPTSILRQSNNRVSRRPGYAMVWSVDDSHNSPD
ncbi:WD40 repeat domain-containing protein [Candidatus Synechococcus calcipolaris G9]|uniref:WD40 repeat domain-containing protein n=1 Tax=Candidatus Synechococcus calcipolaris G9 TaxID=1497997 RepID=A0ABT6EYV9_9SYNE|nr:WD40 repeat domain-containing protein [Candidatus Synechococcus calcipolaris]MDG2990829.1 WD40 repeat domain-containing protein [Candidatus Synechococcus calcipolaris G9]